MVRDIKVKLAQRLRDLRKKYGYSQEEVAAKSGVDYKHLQRIESKKPPSVRLDTIEKLAKVFNLTSSELLKL